MSGEYRGKITIEADTSGSDAAQKSVINLQGSLIGLQSVISGSGQLLKGNAMGLVELGVGARLAWQAMSNFNPYLKAASILLAIAAPLVGKFIGSFGKTQEIESFEKKLKRLGLVASDLENLEKGMKRNADALKSQKDNADAAADAYDRLLQAQKAVADIRHSIENQSLDLEERKKLANPNLSDGQRRSIQVDFAKRRVDMESTQRNEEIDARRNQLSNELQKTKLNQDQLNSEESQLGDAMKSALDVAFKSVLDVSANGGVLNKENYSNMIYKAASGDTQGAIDMADIKTLFSDIPESAKDAAQEAAKNFEKALGIKDDFNSKASTRDARMKSNGVIAEAIQKEADALFAEQKGLPEMAANKKAVIDKELKAEEDRRTNQVRSQEGRYRYEQADPSKQLEYLSQKLKGLSGNDLTAEQRSARLDLIKERDKVLAKITSDAATNEREQAARDGRVADARSGLLATSRDAVQSIDTSAMFEAYYAGGINNTKDAQQLIADRAKQQVEYLKIISDAMKQVSE